MSVSSAGRTTAMRFARRSRYRLAPAAHQTDGTSQDLVGARCDKDLSDRPLERKSRSREGGLRRKRRIEKRLDLRGDGKIVEKMAARIAGVIVH